MFNLNSLPLAHCPLQDLSCKVLQDVKIAMTDLNSSVDHSTLLHEDHDLLRVALAKFTKTTISAINRLYHGTLDGRYTADGMTGAIQAGPSEAVYLIYLSVGTCALVTVANRPPAALFLRWKSLSAKKSSSWKPCAR
jgi:hypothetical protein